MDVVRERVMRRHYGIKISKPFREGYHPDILKSRGMDGKFWCSNLMLWLADKV